MYYVKHRYYYDTCKPEVGFKLLFSKTFDLKKSRNVPKIVKNGRINVRFVASFLQLQVFAVTVETYMR